MLAAYGVTFSRQNRSASRVSISQVSTDPSAFQLSEAILRPEQQSVLPDVPSGLLIIVCHLIASTASRQNVRDVL